ncbi:MAG TPA: peptidase G2 autoproteolytic cleavage domain-containing protein [Pyrinomonadaceae bacterium]|nr:peptidase G2 autoproteolytic cleavage domain-containing protein [Pyrinomonadaceae bacterium]
MFDNFLAGNISSYTVLYPGYDAQSNVIMELGYGTATSNVVPLASLVLSKNLTSANNAIGVISFANSSIANGNEKRMATIGAATDGAPNSGVMTFGTTNAGLIAEQMRITSTGKVGIGNNNPSEKLEITGNLKVSGTGNITAVGTIEGGNIKAKYQDMAEWVESSQELPGGTVVVLDSGKSNHVIASSSAYDSRVAGVISLQPGITLGEHAEGRVLVATTGRVKVKVDASNGPINIGDLLVTSDKSGVAMKSVPVEIGGVRIHRPGTLIGKALEPLAAGTGEILVLLSLQ